MGKRVWVGGSGYFSWGWRGRFYPEDALPSRWFDFYARRFDTVEMNSSFYRIPTEATVKKGPERSRFTVKAPRALEDRLGVVLFHLPPSLRYSPESLEHVRAPLDLVFDNALEFRHPSGWREEVYRALDNADAVFVSVSAPDLPGNYLETAGRAQLRFHGRTARYRYVDSEEKRVVWTRRLCTGSAEVVCAYFDNDPEAAAPQNARAFRGLLEGA